MFPYKMRIIPDYLFQVRFGSRDRIYKVRQIRHYLSRRGPSPSHLVKWVALIGNAVAIGSSVLTKGFYGYALSKIGKWVSGLPISCANVPGLSGYCR